MIEFIDVYKQFEQIPSLSSWFKLLPLQINSWKENQLHGHFYEWFKSLEHLPLLKPQYLNITSNIEASDGNINNIQSQGIKKLLYNLMPWRKGPYSLYGIKINSEWRSDWKWNRIIPHISSLKNKIILDVGCGNGYYMWRMIGNGAYLVIGIDPNQLFLFQFEAIRKLLNNDRRLHVLPFKIEQLPSLQSFDMVFSMGVLYHQRCPLTHILQLKNQLKSGGELVLETIIVRDNNNLLIPKERYAKMRNVFFIPSANLLEKWLKKNNFIDIRIVDYSVTTYKEQRSTKWMNSQSLSNFLDRYNVNKTVEGYPAPVRAILIAKKP
ncbi:tRNA 5-methoxyuridine(34)/uridine 5-oxyacetic acid(34) synthase CmoB [Candidatus Pantoea edessiphila]|uniref:tRNA U34 carboxymethyltransferase n=1 Tax=Candidatus Pantoea edessiphila TaxID=2044610 RepID=A0A2P5SWQ5_9GAMM|nr:tRNA 5-methoxyuridine(34)/uridine 5-oxyacetic acid(34) synthase CmoB [Candidatus Pantoea edessiphila]PPI86752.1 tRNA 5-methoxyuridine(34)/uridine 5-oxyacetic acid(34) synthase CmoB [Candidatus Pantoea edessiphila]